ncbi:DNA helicase [Anaerovorax odorimutans]|uniref:DNA helicase n=1 Tax=Anaerovorax odorimutans TaxID=109327 RepID=UPI000411BB7F|nr:DNA helicase [Anaerovorax odorimutans]
MINEIKNIVQNYLNNVKLCNMINGVVLKEGIKVSDKLTIPNELVKGNLKNFVSVNDEVKLIRNHGGQEFYIVEVIGLMPVTKDMRISIDPIKVSNGMELTSFKIKGVYRK